mmetsp:Transcript_14464/g.31362  ORF Transcript_14464/g.31362 Transcript_14464/m.31362 type:complete len:204 (-) Transcript_14464:1057-1668(-)
MRSSRGGLEAASTLDMMVRNWPRQAAWGSSTASFEESSSSTRVDALKKSRSSRMKILNSSTNEALNSPGLAVMRFSIASLATKSSGPALRCSLFCSVCLISSFRSLGMSLRWAMSRMRVSGTLWRNSPLKEGRRLCMRRAASVICTSAAASSGEGGELRMVSPMLHSKDLNICRARLAWWLGRWCPPVSAHWMAPVLIQVAYT